jgi:hypothetical protein
MRRTGFSQSGDEGHLARALRTAKHIEAKRALHEHRPRDARGDRQELSVEQAPPVLNGNRRRVSEDDGLVVRERRARGGASWGRPRGRR